MNEPSIAHHTVSLADVDLHYVRSGSGPPLILLHGWPQTWYEFHSVIPELAKHFDVIAPDMRGMGDSSKPASGYDVKAVSNDIAQLCDALNLSDVSVVGHDLGGPVAYTLAASQSELVARLALFEAPLPGIELSGLKEFMSNFWHMNFHQVPDMPEALIGGRERLYLTSFFRDFAYDKFAVSAEAIDEFVRCYSAPGGLRSSLAHYRAMPESAIQIASLAETKLTIPCLAFGGERCLGDWTATMLREAAEDVQGGTIDQCGHWVPEERPDWFCRTLREWIFGSNEAASER